MKRRFEIVIVIIVVSLLILLSRYSNIFKSSISTFEMVENLRTTYSNEVNPTIENTFVCDAQSNNVDLVDN